MPGAGAQCSAPAGTVLAVNLGDGDDRYVAEDGVVLPEALGGAEGADRIEAGHGPGALGGGPGGDDVIVRGRTETLEDCGSRPRASLRVPRQRIGAFFDDDGFDFRVRCAQPCAIEWEIVPRDRSTRRRIHQRDRRLGRERLRRDAEGFPSFLEAGTHELHARPVGRTTRRDIRAARLLRLRLVVTVVGRNSVERTLARNLTLRR